MRKESRGTLEETFSPRLTNLLVGVSEKEPGEEAGVGLTSLMMTKTGVVTSVEPGGRVVARLAVGQVGGRGGMQVVPAHVRVVRVGRGGRAARLGKGGRAGRGHRGAEGHGLHLRGLQITEVKFRGERDSFTLFTSNFRLAAVVFFNLAGWLLG